ncbi:hypothetical protein CXG81DRAFT_21110 [Caulochytrium protostelioides]|uniref:Myb-like domain-containing protein n=1 Tax=Caulochytrium protostelioides TaxID=1555241 RepID=A0A4P9X2M1_9FUNG|nr:hypothetical protein CAUPRSCDRAFT_10498 [Caulochytrium protostelioides]RKO98706.1 hypothetical protein CXG81DRAFT_21110 [Caulochytrium protostelioides]|eukprot:RKO98706.1 hypothetical protein CXG81DRAFT_21110 [Caulochytrium protostelioides]
MSPPSRSNAAGDMPSDTAPSTATTTASNRGRAAPWSAYDDALLRRAYAKHGDAPKVIKRYLRETSKTNKLVKDIRTRMDTLGLKGPPSHAHHAAAATSVSQESKAVAMELEDTVVTTTTTTLTTEVVIAAEEHDDLGEARRGEDADDTASMPPLVMAQAAEPEDGAADAADAAPSAALKAKKTSKKHTRKSSKKHEAPKKAVAADDVEEAHDADADTSASAPTHDADDDAVSSAQASTTSRTSRTRARSADITEDVHVDDAAVRGAASTSLQSSPKAATATEHRVASSEVATAHDDGDAAASEHDAEAVAADTTDDEAGADGAHTPPETDVDAAATTEVAPVTPATPSRGFMAALSSAAARILPSPSRRAAAAAAAAASPAAADGASSEKDDAVDEEPAADSAPAEPKDTEAAAGGAGLDEHVTPDASLVMNDGDVQNDLGDAAPLPSEPATPKPVLGRFRDALLSATRLAAKRTDETSSMPSSPSPATASATSTATSSVDEAVRSFDLVAQRRDATEAQLAGENTGSAERMPLSLRAAATTAPATDNVDIDSNRCDDGFETGSESEDFDDDAVAEKDDEDEDHIAEEPEAAMNSLAAGTVSDVADSAAAAAVVVEADLSMTSVEATSLDLDEVDQLDALVDNNKENAAVPVSTDVGDSESDMEAPGTPVIAHVPTQLTRDVVLSPGPDPTAAPTPKALTPHKPGHNHPNPAAGSTTPAVLTLQQQYARPPDVPSPLRNSFRHGASPGDSLGASASEGGGSPTAATEAMTTPGSVTSPGGTRVSLLTPDDALSPRAAAASGPLGTPTRLVAHNTYTRSPFGPDSEMGLTTAASLSPTASSLLSAPRPAKTSPTPTSTGADATVVTVDAADAAPAALSATATAAPSKRPRDADAFDDDTDAADDLAIRPRPPSSLMAKLQGAVVAPPSPKRPRLITRQVALPDASGSESDADGSDDGDASELRAHQGPVSPRDADAAASSSAAAAKSPTKSPKPKKQLTFQLEAPATQRASTPKRRKPVYIPVQAWSDDSDYENDGLSESSSMNGDADLDADLSMPTTEDVPMTAALNDADADGQTSDAETDATIPPSAVLDASVQNFSDANAVVQEDPSADGIVRCASLSPSKAAPRAEGVDASPRPEPGQPGWLSSVLKRAGLWQGP